MYFVACTFVQHVSPYMSLVPVSVLAPQSPPHLPPHNLHPLLQDVPQAGQSRRHTNVGQEQPVPPRRQAHGMSGTSQAAQHRDRSRRSNITGHSTIGFILHYRRVVSYETTTVRKQK